MAKARSSVEPFDARVRELASIGWSSRKIAEDIGINRQSVLDYMKSAGIAKLPRNDIPRREFIDFEGKRYVWCNKGYWRCSSGRRESLSKIIYKRLYPDYIEEKFDAFTFVNGDKSDFTRDNLKLVRIKDAPKEFLMNTEDKRLLNKALGIAGLELIRMRERENPEIKKARIDKIVASRGNDFYKNVAEKRKAKMTPERYKEIGKKSSETKRRKYEARKRLGTT